MDSIRHLAEDPDDDEFDGGEVEGDRLVPLGGPAPQPAAPDPEDGPAERPYDVPAHPEGELVEDFEVVEDFEDAGPVARAQGRVAQPRRAPSGKRPVRRPIARGAVYRHPIVAGRVQPDTPWRRVVNQVGEWLTSAGEREERVLDQRLRGRDTVTRTNVVAVVSPKGGVGKTTLALLIGDVLAELGRIRAVAMDTNPDFGTLGSLAPETMRSDRTLAGLLEDFEDLTPSAAQLEAYLSRVPTGLRLLSAPTDYRVMQYLTAEHYERLVEMFAHHLELVILDLGTGIAGNVAQWAMDRADQVLVVTTPQWVTSNKVAEAISHVPAHKATLVLNLDRSSSPGDRGVIEGHFAKMAIEDRVSIPYDERLATMLDSGSYDLAHLRRQPRLAIKRLAAKVGEGLN